MRLQQQPLQLLIALARASGRVGHARRAPAATLAGRDHRRFRSEPEQVRHQAARSRSGTGGQPAFRRNAAQARLSLHRPGRPPARPATSVPARHLRPHQRGRRSLSGDGGRRRGRRSLSRDGGRRPGRRSLGGDGGCWRGRRSPLARPCGLRRNRGDAARRGGIRTAGDHASGHDRRPREGRPVTDLRRARRVRARPARAVAAER